MAGVFISFEGIDGAGKSTQLDALATAFEQQGRSVTRTREPGGTPLAERLRELLLAQSMDALTEALLLFAARREHLLRVIEPALARGDVVLCDRFTDATFAYQGAGRGFDLDRLGTLERWVQQVPAAGAAPRQPNLTFWFDLAAQRAAGRVQAAARAQDRFESQPVEFFEKVAAGYAARAASDPARFVRIDANGSRHQVWQQLTSALVRRGWLATPVAARGATPPGPAA